MLAVMDLKSYLAAAGEKQTAFAQRIETTPATVSRIAAGKERPGIDLAHKIEQATGGKVPMATWVGFEKPRGERVAA